jgi:hypothetical protein
MSSHVFIAFLLLISAMTLGFFVTDKARHGLTPEQKAKLLDTLHGVRKCALIPAVAYGLIAYLKPVLSWIIPGGAVCIAGIYVLKVAAVRRSELPEIYRRASVMEAGIAFIGILLFVVVGLWPMLAA